MDRLETKDTELHQETLRLNRYLALAGVGSRRKNDELILSGAVRVNGTVVRELGSKVNPGRDRVTVNGKPVQVAHRSLYILLNKPKDCITTVRDERGRTTVMDLVHVRERVYPVGRLDRDTTGVLLLTNDGDLAHGLTHPSSEIEKMYRARLEKSITDDDLHRLKKGVRLSDGPARAREATVIPGTRRKEVLLTVHEGRNHLVKRMFEKLGYSIRQLERVGFAGLTTQGVARGKWRFLQQSEVQYLKSLTERKEHAHARED